MTTIHHWGSELFFIGRLVWFLLLSSLVCQFGPLSDCDKYFNLPAIELLVLCVSKMNRSTFPVFDCKQPTHTTRCELFERVCCLNVKVNCGGNCNSRMHEGQDRSLMEALGWWFLSVWRVWLLTSTSEALRLAIYRFNLFLGSHLRGEWKIVAHT